MNTAPLRILVDSLADKGLTNAQMINAREIVSRLNPERFVVTMFVHKDPAPEIIQRPNTRLIQLPDRLQTLPVLGQFLWGGHDLVFYLKISPAGFWFVKLRSLFRTRGVVAATIESQTNWKDETVNPKIKRSFEQSVLRADYLLSNSDFVKRSLELNYGLPSEVVPTGVDTNFFTPDCERSPNSRPRVLFVGALRSFKGPQVVFDAAQHFPQADFVIAGDGVMAEQLRERAKTIPNLTMPGHLGRIEIRDEYRRADIFLFPSEWEGSPRVLMEAAATGLPVIARKDYEPESVIDGQTGFLVSSEHEIMARLADLMTNADLRKRFGCAGRQHMARFSWDAIVPMWESVFIRIMQARRKDRQS
jgi:glycosyltransferase involved in cell wall biosynthesis